MSFGAFFEHILNIAFLTLFAYFCEMLNHSEKIYFISDIHLGAHHAEHETLKRDRLLSFLQHVEQEDADLVIVGDLFDFWFEYRTVVPRQHFRVLGQLANMAQHNPIHYMAGNHDFWLDSFMSQEIGLHIHPDDFIINRASQRIYIRHGDGLLKTDYGYRFLKKILRNKVNIFLYRLIHPDFGIPFALFWSHLSRNSGEKQKDTYMDVDYRHYAFEKIDEGFDVVILGHTHWPARQQYHDGFYVNPGFWGMDFTYAVVDNGMPELLQWNGREGVPFEITLPPGNQT